MCTTNNVDYITIRKAMCNDARTLDELKVMTGVCTTCDGCKSELEKILLSVCGCKGVSLKEVVDTVADGADTIEKVGKITGAGTDCERCQALIANIIKLGR
ncbi:(2Fe-2S)-binding protein [Anaerotignum sp.]|uniref:(2Fe-2S)-binding protein n=1 Tax=Anaerotignum sp. TaxID=2039241 RepID=UPI0028A8E46A|nr:(2Fe-2S)-binding protein [Anaerotignum sp.]